MEDRRRRVRINLWRGSVPGKAPVVDLELASNQQVVGFAATPIEDRHGRVRWQWTAWVATEMGEVPA